MPAAIVVLLVVVWLLVFLITRYVSLASIVAAAALPLLTLWGSWFHGRIQDGTWNKPLFVFSLVIAILAIWKHRTNIQRLPRGHRTPLHPQAEIRRCLTSNSPPPPSSAPAPSARRWRSCSPPNSNPSSSSAAIRQTADTINREHRNPHYLSEIQLPENVRASIDSADALSHPLIIFAVPTSATRGNGPEARRRRSVRRNPAAFLRQGHREIHRRPDEPDSARGIPGQSDRRRYPDLTTPRKSPPTWPPAPSSAPKTTTSPSAFRNFSHFPHFRSYTSDDLAGIEFGGAVKNVYAIAAGMAHGLGLGDNAVAALVTRALAEMTRLGIALGGRMETFSGLSGVGDLIVTCFSEHSRNHRVGLALGGGKTLEEAVAALGMVAEGVPNTLSIHEAARRVGVRTPIIDGVYSILYEGKSVPLAMRELLTRDPRPEKE